MGVSSYIIYALAIILLIVSYIKDTQKTKKGLLKAWKSFRKLMPLILPLFLFIGILLALITPSFISSILGEDSGFLGYVIGMVVGSITFMSPFVAYPLGVELLENGAAYPQVAGFLVTVMSVGLVYFAVESKYFNKKAAVYRNLISFVGAIIVVLIVLVVYA
ncbi:permease [Candidatus Xianfuyuplasma coldseepsis]|uniref:Permease n=1 Tax=Candidatus Xianfuyuplasma coldseepsis TaxID=2782163 RepID=A0A7L7KSN9_9MOLU|nr:permease [Xianfuyuplasma coldseepsis]QMS85282.1 permease [Xianfuyuplasma coldseepsis]